MHLRPDDFIDIVEGTQPEAANTHVRECHACRRELDSIRAALTMASADTEVPEPPPWFWERLSSDVRQRIAAAPDPRVWWSVRFKLPLLVPASAVATVAIVLAVALWSRAPLRPANPGTTALDPPAASNAASFAESGTDTSDADPMLTLVADLSAGMDLEAAADVGFASADAAEDAVTHLNADELRALERLLRAELTRPGA